MELYAAALSMLLVRRDHERGIAVPEGIRLTEQESMRLLQRLAYWLIRNGQTEMEHSTALALLADALPAMPSVAGQGDADQVLQHLIGRTGRIRSPQRSSTRSSLPPPSKPSRPCATRMVRFCSASGGRQASPHSRSTSPLLLSLKGPLWTG